MHELFPKFIIEDGNLIIGKVTYHRQLAKDITSVVSGGWFIMNYEQKEITFYGESDQFGRATLEQIKKCIEEDKVFTNKYSSHSIAGKFKFLYKQRIDSPEAIPLN